jgi:hypothetical protein
VTRKPTQIVQIKLRLQERLRREVEKLAKKSGRSLNGELVALIELALETASQGRRWAALEETISRSVAENAEGLAEIADLINRLLDVQREHAGRSEEKREEREKSAPPNTEQAGEKSE